MKGQTKGQRPTAAGEHSKAIAEVEELLNALERLAGAKEKGLITGGDFLQLKKRLLEVGEGEGSTPSPKAPARNGVEVAHAG